MKDNYKFKMWDWDEGRFYAIPMENVVEAIYFAWNYEFDVYEIDSGEMIFSGQLDNEDNSEMLEKYGLRVIDGEKYRNLQNIETGEIYKANWEEKE
ncbi:hypothetical protein P4V72_05810 [Bacillus thuringiensis]|uniref:Uncharacterized protein n=3 Tax=root TaxID=1 RepID=A0A4P8MXL8_9CAUD|nr:MULTISPECIES: hypothetical protein [Bacillus cereus group]YP_009845486.1 hypothetical protein HWC18_gp50 [Bacillus phage vB_BtS_B83]MEB9095254.1 hypothetical protein [Bacillus cereus]AQY42414.1 hypothetical protein B4918_31125 [Bacillus thuringiensis]EJP81252.1 hypothetical protein IC1_06498 [Bacillus cereus VD022]EOQ55873.1 hypothetical protein IAY_06505 [Bacillus cereus TIAC219]MDR4148532.1 hypothetical protein [Bacillus thuringiensis]